MDEPREDNRNIDLTLLANFTHQVINPLNGVAGTLDNLIDGTIGDIRRGQRTKAARAQLENVITLVRNLAYLASDKLDAGLTADRIIVLPQAIIEAAMFYQEEGKSKKISIDLINKADQNKIFGHTETLKQVLMNLFDNAIKYSAFASRVEIRQWIQSHTGHAIITVSSTPKSLISQEIINNMFSLGYRGVNARDIVASGTGIGLYICRYLIENRHGGTISAQLDKGNLVFTIKVPAEKR